MSRFPLRARMLAALAFTALAVHAPAQVGWRDEVLTNSTSSGSAVMPTRFFYPATRGGQNAPIQPGSHPVVVFLNGYGSINSGYRPLGERFAAAGYISVHCDTARSNYTLQRQDSIAMFPTLQTENGRAGSFFRGALDMTRAAIAGHSMGGGNTIRVLANNPGYRTGMCFAPEGGATSLAPQIAVPLLLVHGEGDGRLPWQTCAQAYFDTATAYADLKAFVLLDQNCNHSNLVHVAVSAPQTHHQVFDRSVAAAIGWLDEHLRGQVNGLEEALGPPMLGDPRVTRLQSAVRTPRLWVHGNAVIGGSFQLRLAGEAGLAALMVAEAQGTVRTPLGLMRLDPVTTNWLLTVVTGAGATVINLNVPNDPNLLGLDAWFQAVTYTDGFGFRFTNAVRRTGTR